MYKFSHHLVNAPETTATPQRSSPVKLALQNSGLVERISEGLVCMAWMLLQTPSWLGSRLSPCHRGKKTSSTLGCQTKEEYEKLFYVHRYLVSCLAYVCVTWKNISTSNVVTLHMYMFAYHTYAWQTYIDFVAEFQLKLTNHMNNKTLATPRGTAPKVYQTSPNNWWLEDRILTFPLGQKTNVQNCWA